MALRLLQLKGRSTVLGLTVPPCPVVRACAVTELGSDVA